MTYKEKALQLNKEEFERSAIATMRCLLEKESQVALELSFIRGEISDLETATEETHRIASHSFVEFDGRKEHRLEKRKV